MIGNKIVLKIGFLAALAAGLSATAAAPRKAEPGIQLTEAGKQLEAKYAATLTALQGEITKALPAVPEQNNAANQAAQAALAQARTHELVAAKVLLTGLESFLSSDRLDAKLVKCTVLAEANESKEKQKVEQAHVAEADRKVVVGPDGIITIPAVAHRKPSGHFAAMKSFSGGMQLHGTGGFKAEYAIEVSRAGKYLLAAQVATVQEGQKFQLAANDSQAPVEMAVPYTIGKWQPTQPVEISLVNGKNVFHFTLTDGSRGVTIKEFTLTPVK